MAVNIVDCISYMNKLLDINNFRDYCPNGLQVEGCCDINKIVSGVSVSQKLFAAAKSQQADLILVHHGLFWYKQSMCITGVQQQRIKQLLANDINLAAYHLPLDAHMQIGNNIKLAECLKARYVEDLSDKKPSIGIVVELPVALSVAKLTELISKKLSKQPDVFLGDKKLIKKIAICSGAAQHDFLNAIEKNADAFITGEVSEFVPYLALESGVHYFAAGHYATETFGVRALGEKLSQQFGVEHEFIDIENKV